MLSNSDGTLKYDTLINSEGFKKGLDGLKSIAKSSFVAVGAAATAAFVTISKAAISSYAEYEQLAGGVETLFKDSSDTVKKYADEAYKTSGLSANEYMSTVTSFSASLLQSLGNDTAKSAEYADQAIIDMSDNANKMGTDMEAIQNAYQGFAKQNYTMLDNLKLGYGGTKEEMQRLLEDASKLSGIEYDISSFADVTQAIHVIQTEMGITGTTAKEATATIQGSFGMMAASWKNLLTGVADDTQNFDVLLENFIDSIGSVMENLLPRVTIVAEGALNLIKGLLPQIPVLFQELLPVVLESVHSIAEGIISALPELMQTISGILPQVIDGIINLLPSLLDAGLQIILSLAQGIVDSLPQLIPKVVDIMLEIVKTLLDNIDQIAMAAIDIIVALAEGLINALPELLEELPTIITKIVIALTDPSMLAKLIAASIQLMAALTEGLIKSIPAILVGVAKVVPAIIQGFVDRISNFVQIGKDLVSGLWSGIVDTKDWLINNIKKWCGTVVDGIKSFFGIHSPSTLFRDEIGKMMVAGMGEGISDNKDIVTDALSDVYHDMSKVTPESIDGENALKLLQETFGDIPEEYYALGQNSGDSFVNGFLEKIPFLMNSIRGALQQSISYIVGGNGVFALSGAGASSIINNNYSSSYTFNSSKDTTTAQLQAAQAADTLNRLRGR